MRPAFWTSALILTFAVLVGSEDRVYSQIFHQRDRSQHQHQRDRSQRQRHPQPPKPTHPQPPKRASQVCGNQLSNCYFNCSSKYGPGSREKCERACYDYWMYHCPYH